MNRFGFSILAAITQLAACVPRPIQNVEQSWTTMGTIFSATIWTNNSEKEAFGAIRSVLADVDKKMSIYREDSEINQINRAAGSGRPVRVSSDTFDVIEEGLKVGRESGGRFNIAIGPLVSLWHLYEPWKGEDHRLPELKEIQKAREMTNLDDVVLDSASSSISLVRKGMRLDLNGIAKGFALDLAVKKLRELGVTRALLNLGGQIIVIGSPPEGKNWKIGIRTPGQPNAISQNMEIASGSISTSGNYERYFSFRGKRYGHIIDPVTGWPVEHGQSVTVKANTGTQADEWSTALFVAGPKEGKQLLLRHPDLEATWTSSSYE